MTAPSRRNLSLVALISLAAAALVGGCADNNQSLFILGNAIPDDSCEIKPSEEGPFLGRGVFDLVLGTSYYLHPVVRNDMPNMVEMKGFGDSDGRLDAHNITLRKAEISYTYDDPAFTVSHISSKTVTISGMVWSAGGLSALNVEIIDSELTGQFRGKMPSRSENTPYPTYPVSVDVQIIGEMGDGSEIRSSVFTYPMHICQGCLLEFPTEADDTDSPTFDCDNFTGDMGDPPCNPGQDWAYDCRYCKQVTGRSEDCDPL